MSADLVVIVPTRGRPHAARELRQAFRDTSTGNTELVFAVDSDDPTRPEYGHDDVIVAPGPSNMVTTLNYVASALLPPRIGRPFGVAFMGDDHRPRSAGWDSAYLETLCELRTGLVYGDDLVQGESLPTQIAMTSDIIRAVGYMAPPDLVHLFVDNFWMSLGRLAGCLRYRPDVVIEHVHPITKKVGWDEGHQRVNAPEMYARDQAAWGRFCISGQMGEAVEKVRALRGES
jgi:hypothetical protein